MVDDKLYAFAMLMAELTGIFVTCQHVVLIVLPAMQTAFLVLLARNVWVDHLGHVKLAHLNMQIWVRQYSQIALDPSNVVACLAFY